MSSATKTLTSAQKTAITTASDKHAVVIAVAGAGKTTVLEQRSRYLIQKGLKNQLIITFTKKASKNIVDRLGTVPDTVFIGTFHSFCYKVLNEFAPDKLGTKFITEAEEFKLYIYANQSIKDRNLRVEPKDAILRIDHFFRRGLMPTEWLSADKNTSLNRVALDVYNKARAEGYMFFGDLVLETMYLVSTSLGVRDELAARYPIIMVDEFQDTDDVQVTILQWLIKSGSQLFVVGDAAQAIYTWRGCNPKVINDFEATFGPAARIVLDTNFRSTDAILGAGNALLTNMGAVTRMVGVRRADTGVHFTRFLSPIEEAKAIATTIKERGIAKDTAILYRSNSQSGAFESELGKQQIPFVVSGNAKSFFEFPEIKPLVCYLRLLTNLSDVDSLRYVWNRPNRFLKNEWLSAAAANTASLNVFDVLRETGSRRLSASQRQGLNLLENFFRVCTDTTMKPKELLITMIKTFKYADYLKQLAAKSLTREYTDINRAVEQFVNICGEFATIRGVLTHIDYVKALQQQTEILRDGVTLTTIHSSKGLEFPVVFLIGAEEGILPHENSTDIEEEHRLAYVAVTRAETELRVSYYDNLSRFMKPLENPNA